MRNTYILIFLCTLLCSCNNNSNHTAELKDFDSIAGTWTSVANDTYEVWQKADGKLEGQTYRLINDSLKLVNEAEIRIEGSDCFFEMDLSNPNKVNRLYKGVWIDSMSKYVFKNDTVFPKFLAYLEHPNKGNLIVLAGESYEAKDYFEFLYQKIDSLPQ